MRERIRRKLIAILLLLTLVGTAAGCVKTTGEGNASQTTDREKTAMGRYMETETDLTEQLESVMGLRKLSDGSLMILDQYMSFQISKDHGNIWEEWNPEWLKEMREKKVYFLGMDVGPDGTVGIIYDDSDDDELHPKCALMKPDGTRIEIEIPVPEESKYPRHIWISDTGRYFVGTLGPELYEIKEDGSSELFLTLDSGPELIQFQGSRMVIDGYGYDSPVIYDLEKKDYAEDEILEEFIEEYYPERQSGMSNCYGMYFFPGEENVLYLAGGKGLHRHVLGGSAVEQVIDGNLSRLSSPEYMISGMLALENHEFLAVFNNGKVVRFTYDPDVPTVPNQKLKIYSLEENASIRQAISSYQVQNPEIYVEYEIGMEENSPVTREDALKKLNTKVMAGEGPDILVLDHLPIDSYREKGLLLDLSEFLTEFSKEEPLFDNMVHAFESEQGIYAVPGQVDLPLMMGKEKYVSQMNNLEGISTALKQMRDEAPGKDLLGICGEKHLLKLFSITSAPGFRTKDGSINEDAVREFLILVKAIYEIQMDGIDESRVEFYERNQTYWEQELGEDWAAELMLCGIDIMRYLGKEKEMTMGILTYPSSYANITSVQKVESFEDTLLTPMSGQCQNVFIPNTLLGISAASDQPELAEDFLKLFLGKDVQSALGGFSVNRQAHDEIFTPDPDYISEDGIYGYASSSYSGGERVELTVYWPMDEQLITLKKWMEAADTPYIEDPVVEKAIFDEGAKFMQGGEDINAAISQIKQKLSIYLAE